MKVCARVCAVRARGCGVERSHGTTQPRKDNRRRALDPDTLIKASRDPDTLIKASSIARSPRLAPSAPRSARDATRRHHAHAETTTTRAPQTRATLGRLARLFDVTSRSVFVRAHPAIGACTPRNERRTNDGCGAHRRVANGGRSKTGPSFSFSKK